MTQPSTLPVIFRAERSGPFKGDVTAVFPTMPHDPRGHYVTCYAHIGQHSGGSLDWYRGTRPATVAESAALLAELTQIYDDVTLKVYQRMTAAHRAEMRDATRV